jgi:hypothetical protein
MKLSNLKGLDQDLNRGLDYNKKHGGVSDTLKKTMKRPEGFRNGEGSGLMHFSGEPIPSNKKKCKCGNTMFYYQKICGQCYLKNLTKKDEI